MRGAPGPRERERRPHGHDRPAPPLGITLLALLAGLAALVALWHTLQYLHLLPFTLGPLQFYGFDLLGALLWGGLTAIWVWAAVRLWNVEPQGLVFATVLSGLNLILAGLSLLGASTLEALLPALLLNGGILLYCLSPGVRRALGRPRRDAPWPGDGPGSLEPPPPAAIEPAPHGGHQTAAPAPRGSGRTSARAAAAPGGHQTAAPGGGSRSTTPRQRPPGAVSSSRSTSARQTPPPAAPAPGAGVPAAGDTSQTVAQLQKLAELKAQGILTDAEFEEQKRKILGA